VNALTAANFVLVGGLICKDAHGAITWREASANGDVISYAFFCSRIADTSDRPSNDTMNDMFMQSIFNSVWT